MEVGLLPKHAEDEVPRAYNLYQWTDSSNKFHAKEFKATSCRDVIIDFIGVW